MSAKRPHLRRPRPGVERAVAGMTRLSGRGLLPLFVLLTACTAPAQQPVAATRPTPVPAVGTVPAVAPPAAAPPRSAPTRPVVPELWPVSRLHNADYVSLGDVAQRFGLKLAWTRAEQMQTLSDARGVRFKFESNQNDFYFDGLRVFLGRPVLLHKGGLCVSLLDVMKLVAPLFRPDDHRAQLPAAPPHTIVLDPGHGGIDPGKENKRLGLNEKTLTLDVALRLRQLLEARGWRVLLVRDKDVELAKDKKTDLSLRNEFANRNKADLFVSIHFNSAERATGVETYTLSPQFMFTTGDDSGDDMTKVSFPGNRHDHANLFLGEQLHRALLAGLRAPDRGFKRARLAVLRMLDCPGVLVECGFLSNDDEARRIATPEYRQKIAEALAAGVQNYAAALAALRPAPAPVSP
ncbi:MAG: N-acetylmuramoyl-L-alanine amidase [Opitutae bacterium]